MSAKSETLLFRREKPVMSSSGFCCSRYFGFSDVIPLAAPGIAVQPRGGLSAGPSGRGWLRFHRFTALG